MISDIITVGIKLDIKKAGKLQNTEEKPKIYMSKVEDIISEEQIKIAMPIDKGKLVLLQINQKYTLTFYVGANLYQCTGVVKDRYKSRNLYFVVVEITSSLQKIQRREYYRLECAQDIKYLTVTEEMMKNGTPEMLLESFGDEKPVFTKAIIVDISGGGIRIVSDMEAERDSFLMLDFKLPVNQEARRFLLYGRILSTTKLQNRTLKFEHRIEFIRINNKVRETIIRYIFEEERKKRRNDKN